MRNRLIFSTLFLAAIFFVSFAYAGPNPPGGPPKIFSGNVYVNGSPLSTGTYTLTAWIGSGAVSQTTVSGGHYSNLQISTSDNYGTIIFFVNGVEANETGSWNNNQNNDWGQNVYLDLNLSQTPSQTSLCGNGAVDLGEECDGINLAGRSSTDCGSGWTGTISCSSTCTIDYSGCTQTSSSSGGNGGGNDNNGGGGGSSGTSSSGTSAVTTSVSSGSLSGSSSSGANTNNNGGSNTGSVQTPPGITGLSIFGLGGTGSIIALIVFLLLLAGIIYLSVKRRKK